jgi:hypothetical protein
MTSERKVTANRANARASTGPRTRQGKIRSAQNARRHGFSVSVLIDPLLSEDAENLAHALAGKGASAAVLEPARRAAEAQIDLRRVEARRSLLNRYLSNPRYKPYGSAAKLKERIRALDYLGAMMTRMTPQEISDPFFQKFASGVIGEPPQGSKKFMYILADLSKRLSAMDRYERRALSRRKFAIRELDVLRGNTLT